jgi:glycosyltransferase involved in cell wall biosynthesis
MTVSVVVPTRDRPASLLRCLEALARQDLADLDLVVVDDGSRDRAALEDAVASAPGVRCLRTPGRGPAAARNVGVEAARGEVVCFTDDDCEPAAGWAASLAAAARATGIAAGLTIPPSEAAAPVLASQAITNHLLTASLDAAGNARFAPTCNLALTRERRASLRFDERFPDAAGEDREWSARAVAAGMPIHYEPRAVVVHRQRLDAPGFLRQQFRYGRGATRFRRLGAREGRARARPSFYLRLIASGFERGPIVGGLVVLAQLAVAAGAGIESGSEALRGRRGGAG